MKRVYVLLGGLYSIDGLATSAGMLTLVTRLKGIPNTVVKWFLWGDYQSCFRDANAADPGDQVILIGYSGGGWRICTVAGMMSKYKEDVALLVAYDPSPSWNMSLPENILRPNVKKAVCYQNESVMWIPFIGAIGGGKLVVGAGGPTVDVRPIKEQHLSVQFDAHLHDQTVALVSDLK